MNLGIAAIHLHVTEKAECNPSNPSYKLVMLIDYPNFGPICVSSWHWRAQGFPTKHNPRFALLCYFHLCSSIFSPFKPIWQEKIIYILRPGSFSVPFHISSSRCHGRCWNLQLVQFFTSPKSRSQLHGSLLGCFPMLPWFLENDTKLWKNIYSILQLKVQRVVIMYNQSQLHRQSPLTTKFVGCANCNQIWVVTSIDRTHPRRKLVEITIGSCSPRTIGTVQYLHLVVHCKSCWYLKFHVWTKNFRTSEWGHSAQRAIYDLCWGVFFQHLHNLMTFAYVKSFQTHQKLRIFWRTWQMQQAAASCSASPRCCVYLTWKLVNKTICIMTFKVLLESI